MPARVRRAAGTAAVLAVLVAGASGQPTEGTALEGDVPADLAGRWLIVEQNRLPGGVVHPFARLWEIRQGQEHFELVLRRVRLPEVLTTKLVAAGSANRPWMPAEGDLRTRCSAGTNPSDPRIQGICPIRTPPASANGPAARLFA